MSLKDEVEQLRRVPIFANIEPAKLKLLAFSSRRLRFNPGDLLFRQGEIGDAAYVVLHGAAEVLVDSPAGPLHVADVGPNEIVGEVAILCDVTRTATVRAAGNLDVLRIEKTEFFRLIGDFPDMAIGVMRVLAHRLGETTSELIEARARLNAGHASGLA
jgi:CRP-like cAMP-binding protein